MCCPHVCITHDH
ncbi:putative membrane protein, partial [Chlamydia psittaci 84-8471/1]